MISAYWYTFSATGNPSSRFFFLSFFFHSFLQSMLKLACLILACFLASAQQEPRRSTGQAEVFVAAVFPKGAEKEALQAKLAPRSSSVSGRRRRRKMKEFSLRRSAERRRLLPDDQKRAEKNGASLARMLLSGVSLPRGFANTVSSFAGVASGIMHFVAVQKKENNLTASEADTILEFFRCQPLTEKEKAKASSCFRFATDGLRAAECKEYSGALCLQKTRWKVMRSQRVILELGRWMRGERDREREAAERAVKGGGTVMRSMRAGWVQVADAMLRVFKMSEPGDKTYIPLVVLSSIVLLAACVLLIVGLMTRHLWYEKFQLLLVCSTIVSAAFRLFYSILRTTGYQNIGYDNQVPRVSITAVLIINRLGGVSTALLCALFAFILIRAILSVHFAEKKKEASLAAGLVFGIVSLLAAVYCITMVVYTSAEKAQFVFDASDIVLSALTLLWAAVLTCVLFVAFRLTAQLSGEARRNLNLFLGISVGLTILFALRLIFVCLWLFVGAVRFGTATFAFNVVAEFAIALAVLAYVGSPVVSSLLLRKRRKGTEESSAGTARKDGYVQLSDAIPAQYNV